MEETQTQQAASNGNRSIMMLIVILLLAGAVVYLAMNRNSANTNTTETEITDEATSDSTTDDNNAMEGSDDAMTADEKKMAPTGGDTMMEAEGEVKEFTIKGDEFTFAPNTMTVNKGDTVRITFENTEGFHDLVIDEFDVATAQMQAGGTETVEFVADQAGSFEYYCSVGQHRQMGMVGTLTVK